MGQLKYLGLVSGSTHKHYWFFHRGLDRSMPLFHMIAGTTLCPHPQNHSASGSIMPWLSYRHVHNKYEIWGKPWQYLIQVSLVNSEAVIQWRQLQKLITKEGHCPYMKGFVMSTINKFICNINQNSVHRTAHFSGNWKTINLCTVSMN